MATLSKKIINPRFQFIWDRIILGFLIILGIVLFFAFRFDRLIQLAIIIILLAIFLLWGILHHYRTKTLSSSTMLEYIAVVLIVVILILSSLN